MFRLGIFLCFMLCAFQNQVNGNISMPVPQLYSEGMTGFVSPTVGPAGASITNEGAAWLGAVPNLAHGIAREGAGLLGQIEEAHNRILSDGSLLNYSPYQGFSQGSAPNTVPEMWKGVNPVNPGASFPRAERVIEDSEKPKSNLNDLD